MTKGNIIIEKFGIGFIWNHKRGYNIYMIRWYWQCYPLFEVFHYLTKMDSVTKDGITILGLTVFLHRDRYYCDDETLAELGGNYK